MGTKSDDVPSINTPRISDLVAAAPTKPITISTIEMGAARISYMVPVNFGKYIPKDAFDILSVSKESIIRPGTMKEP